MSQISILYRLQQIDSQLDNARSSLQNVEKELGNTTLVQSAQEEFIQSEAVYQKELKQVHEIENKVKAIRIKIEQSEASLYGGKIHNTKELQDLQNEIASLRRSITANEDRELEAMMVLEEAETSMKLHEKALIEAQGKQIERNAILSAERTKLAGQIERLEAERNATSQPILPADIELYDQLRKARKGVAVAKISSRACDACGTTLTPAIIQSSQSPGQMVRCPTCGRILYPG